MADASPHTKGLEVKQRPHDTLRSMLGALGRFVQKYGWAVFMILAVFAYLAQPLWRLTFGGSTDDWRYFYFHWEVSRTTIVHYGQFPFWNPYHCGGTVHLANAQSQFLSPLMWPALVLGVPLGLKLFMLLHFFIGMWGTWLFAKDQGLRGWYAVVPSVIFCLSGYFAYHLGGGHSSFLPFLYMPLTLACYYRSLKDIRYVAATGGLVALMVFEGGVYPTPFMVVLLGSAALYRFFCGGFNPKVLTRLAMAAVLGGLLASIKLLPLMEFMMEQSRHVPSDDSIAFHEVFEIFLSRRLERAYPGHPYVWPEYAAYIGIPIFSVAVLALLARWRKHKESLFIGAVFLGLMLGNHGSFSPWEILRNIPVFGSLHVPSRFAVVVVLYLALFAGVGFQEFGLWVQRMRLKPWAKGVMTVLPVLLFVGASADIIHFSQHQLTRFRDRPVPGRSEGPFKISRLPWHQTPSYPRHKKATIACYEGNPVKRGRVRADLPSEAYVAGRGIQGMVGVVSWSPNRVEVEVDQVKPGELVVLNQNDHQGWRVRGLTAEGAGDEVEGVEKASHDGMVAARVVGPQGFTGTIVFSYRPPSFGKGLFFTLLGLFGVGLVGFGLRESHMKRLVAKMASLVLQQEKKNPSQGGDEVAHSDGEVILTRPDKEPEGVVEGDEGDEGEGSNVADKEEQG